MAETTGETISAIWRQESARLVGALTRMTRDLDLAEDLAQDALVSALESWPTQGLHDGRMLRPAAKAQLRHSEGGLGTAAKPFTELNPPPARDARAHRLGGAHRHLDRHGKSCAY